MLPRTILVPTDFSPPAGRALRYALELADKLGAKVHLLHIYQLPVFAAPGTPWVVTADIVNAVESAARTELDAIVARENKPSLTSHLKMGDPRAVIESAATELGADLICMGTHGRRGFGRILLGSVAEYVVRMSSIPVLIVHEEETKQS